MKSASRVLLAIVSVVLWAFGPDAAAQTGESDLPQPAQRSVPAARQADDVVIIALRGEIDRWSELSVKRRIEQAQASGADAIVIEVDSPGGEVGAVLEICNAIKASTIPNTVAWVHPDAYSGGAIVALACREMVSSSPASMGDAFPITFGPMGVRGLSPDERTKFLPPLLTEVADSARRNGYSEFLVQAMIVDGIELWSVRDAETGQRWFINEAEYRVLFDGKPPRGKPAVPGITGGRASDQALSPIPSPSDSAPGESDLADEPGAAEEGEPGEDADVASEPEPEPHDPAPVSEAAFTPAAPGLDDLTQSISDNLTSASTRPSFTEADRGRFIDPVYITDGTGPIVLRDDQLREYGFSTTTIQNDTELQAYFGAERMIRTEQSWSESMVQFLMHPVVRGVLIVILLLGLFVEMSSPGMIVPGALAMGALIGIIAPPMLVGMAGWWELVALGLGAICMLVELLVLPGFGVFGVLGLMALFAGLVGTFIPDGSGGLFSGDRAATAQLMRGVVTVLLATVSAGVLIYFLAKHFGSFPLLSRLVLADASASEEDPIAVMAPLPAREPEPGDVGVAASPLRPSGRVRVNGRMIEASAHRGFIEAGDPVELMRRDSFAWVVRQASQASPAPESQGEPAEGEDPEPGSPPTQENEHA